MIEVKALQIRIWLFSAGLAVLWVVACTLAITWMAACGVLLLSWLLEITSVQSAAALGVIAGLVATRFFPLALWRRLEDIRRKEIEFLARQQRRIRK